MTWLWDFEINQRQSLDLTPTSNYKIGGRYLHDITM